MRKFLRTNKRHLRFKEDRCNGIAERNFCDGHGLTEFITKLDLLMDEGRILKNGNTCYVSHLCWNNKDVVVKRFNYKGLLHSIRHTIKGSRAKKGWINGHRLCMLEIATPRPLAYFEKLRGPFLWKSYLVTEYVNGKQLDRYIDKNKINQKQVDEVMKQIKSLTDKMAKYKITHNDLKHSNILITDNGPVIIDLDALRIHKWFRIYVSK